MVRFDASDDLLDQRHHGRRAAMAVDADHVGAVIAHDLAGLRDRAIEVTQLPAAVHCEAEHQWQVEILRHLDGDLGLPEVGDGLADDHVDTLFGGPGELFGEDAAHLRLALGVAWVEDVGVADVAGHEAVRVTLHHAPGDTHGLAVQGFQQVLLPDQPQLFPVAVVGEGQHDVGSGTGELGVQFFKRVRMLQHHLGHVGPGLQIAAPFHLEEVTAGVQDGIVAVQPIQERTTLLTAHLNTPAFS